MFHDADIAPPLYLQYLVACIVVLLCVIILLDTYHAVCACVGVVVVGVHVHADSGDQLAVRNVLLICDVYLVTLQQYGLWFGTLSGEVFYHMRRYGKDHPWFIWPALTVYGYVHGRRTVPPTVCVPKCQLKVVGLRRDIVIMRRASMRVDQLVCTPSLVASGYVPYDISNKARLVDLRTVNICTVQALAAHPLAAHPGGMVGRGHYIVERPGGGYACCRRNLNT